MFHSEGRLAFDTEHQVGEERDIRNKGTRMHRQDRGRAAIDDAVGIDSPSSTRAAFVPLHRTNQV